MRSCYLLLLCVSLFLFSCEPSLPPGILSEEKMERVLYDFHVAQAMAEVDHSGKDMEARRYELQEAVLRKHGITQADFDSSMVFYCSDLNRLNTIYSHLSIRLERDAEAMGASMNASDIYAGLTAEGDTANVWMGRPVFAVRNHVGENLQSWTIPCDSTWLAGDDLLWRFQMQHFSREGYQNIYASLVVTYTNDSVRAQNLQITERTVSELRIDNSKGWVVHDVAGHFYLPVDNDPQRYRLYIISQISLIRFHKTQEWRDRLLSDSLSLDSLGGDSIASGDTLRYAIEPLDDDTSQHRLSPLEFRNQQDVDRKINIVKEKPYQLRKRKKKAGQRKVR